jgi:hypothetical protein
MPLNVFGLPRGSRTSKPRRRSLPWLMTGCSWANWRIRARPRVMSPKNIRRTQIHRSLHQWPGSVRRTPAPLAIPHATQEFQGQQRDRPNQRPCLTRHFEDRGGIVFAAGMGWCRGAVFSICLRAGEPAAKHVPAAINLGQVGACCASCDLVGRVVDPSIAYGQGRATSTV